MPPLSQLHSHLRTRSSQHEWLGSVFIALGMAIAFAMGWAVLVQHGLLREWLGQAPLVHHLMLGGGILGLLLLANWFICIGCRFCDQQDLSCPMRSRGFRFQAFPEALNVVGALGSNPLRAYRPIPISEQ